MKTKFMLLFLWLSSIVAWGQKTTVVKDIYPEKTNLIIGNLQSNRSFIEINNIVYFVADDAKYGSELWRTDGTESGTFLVKDINEGKLGSSPIDFFNFNGKLFFIADDGILGKEVWSSDGTSNGTKLLKDLSVGNSTISGWKVIDNKLLFFESKSNKIWSTDGTSAGTQELKFLNNIFYNIFYQNYSELLVKIGNTFYYSGQDSKGIELWKSDGTENGTFLVKDINPSGNSTPINFVILNNKLYFNAFDSKNGLQLWTSDGTESGTKIVKIIDKKANSTILDKMLIFKNNIYFKVFKASNIVELWKSDGTEIGTMKITEIGEDDTFSDFQIIGNNIYVIKNNIIFQFDGNTLKKINYNTTPHWNDNSYFSLSDSRLINIENQPFFFTSSSNDKNIFYLNKISDKDTVAQTLGYSKNIFRTSISTHNSYIVNKNKIYFYGSSEDFGFELYKTELCKYSSNLIAIDGFDFCKNALQKMKFEVETINPDFSVNYVWRFENDIISKDKTISISKIGNYHVESSNNDGCIITNQFRLNSSQINVKLVGNLSICKGQVTTLTAIPETGLAPFTFKWSKNNLDYGNTDKISINSAGTYNIFIKDNKGCLGKSVSAKIIEIDSSPNVTITKSGATDIITGSSVVLSVPSASSQTYQWLKDGVAILGATNNTYTATGAGSFSVNVTGNGCTATSEKVVVSLILANELENESKDFKVFPNPVENILKIIIYEPLKKAAKLNLLNSTGKIINEWSVNQQENTFSITGVPAGVYVIKGEINGKKSSQKIIKQD